MGNNQLHSKVGRYNKSNDTLPNKNKNKDPMNYVHAVELGKGKRERENIEEELRLRVNQGQQWPVVWPLIWSSLTVWEQVFQEVSNLGF